MTRCERWIDISDRLAIGDEVSTDDRAFLRWHAHECSACGEEAAVYGMLARGLDEDDIALGETGKDRLPAVRPEARPSETTREAIRRPAPGRLRKSRWMPFVAGSLAAAAAALLVVFIAMDEDGSGSARAPVAGAKDESAQERNARADHSEGAVAPLEKTAGKRAAVAVVLSGAAFVSGPGSAERSALTIGARLARGTRIETTDGSLCLAVDLQGARVCLDRGSVADLVALDKSSVEIRVARGEAIASLEPLAEGARFVLSSTEGTITAVGTVFSLEVDDRGRALTRLFQGRVTVRAGDREAQSLEAGQAIELGEDASRPITHEELVHAEKLIQKPLDDEVLAGKALDRRATKRAHPRAHEAPHELLRSAREHRAAGRAREAVHAYRELERRFPETEEARAALVSLGQVLLRPLGRPSQALRSFSAYLERPGGTLRPEAELGRIEAYRALKRRSDERAAIERFLAAYPRSPHHERLTRRLSALR